MAGPFFKDREEAGRQLGVRLKALAALSPIVVGIPRGGVVVAFAVAEALQAPLDIVVARKVGSPGNPEFGIGAVAEGGVEVRDAASLEALGVTPAAFAAAAKAERAELARRVSLFRRALPAADLRGRLVILVDDGIATGVSARAAVLSLRKRAPRRLVLAVPVASAEAVRELGPLVDELVALHIPREFLAVGRWFASFEPTDEEEVVHLLERGQRGRAPGAQATPRPAEAAASSFEESVPAEAERLTADFTVPPGARGVVLFAHGSGSGRRSPRNLEVARRLEEVPFATVLVDLLTPAEAAEDARRGHLRFAIDFLAERLLCASDFVSAHPRTRSLPLAYFGASTGAAAALKAAALRPRLVRAVVSRGGRPDLAEEALARVVAPTLLIVGGADTDVLRLNEHAARRLGARATLVTLPRATHLFEEEGALEQVAKLAADWLAEVLPRASAAEAAQARP